MAKTEAERFWVKVGQGLRLAPVMDAIRAYVLDKAPSRPQVQRTPSLPAHGMAAPTITLYAVVCPACGCSYQSNLQRNVQEPTFYTGQPWRCLPCRTGGAV